ncbi:MULTISPECIES: hemin uptake protein HemP [Kiloniella]|nr:MULTISPECIES: hemin uptake protein HemP [Kiloniella]
MPDNLKNTQDSMDDASNRSGQMPRVSAETLMQNTREIVIEYQGSDYRLRITSNNKLILTK